MAHGGLALATALVLALAPGRPAYALAWHWPWHHHAHAARAGAVAPGLTIRLEGASSSAGVPQSWDRNMLLVDLTHLGGSGSATLTPSPNAGWPARLGFRVQPGSIASLEVEGAQRVQYTVPTHGAVMTVQLDPGIYVVRTPSLTLHWSAADGLPH
jgi:hypothetical protein